jgi:fumarate hydratase class II
MAERRIETDSLGTIAIEADRYCEPQTERVAETLRPHLDRIAENVAKSLMLVTAFNPHIAYSRPVTIGKSALAENTALQKATTALGFVSAEDFDRWMVPADGLHFCGALAGGGV